MKSASYSLNNWYSSSYLNLNPSLTKCFLVYLIIMNSNILLRQHFEKYFKKYYVIFSQRFKWKYFETLDIDSCISNQHGPHFGYIVDLSDRVALQLFCLIPKHVLELELEIVFNLNQFASYQLVILIKLLFLRTALNNNQCYILFLCFRQFEFKYFLNTITIIFSWHQYLTSKHIITLNIFLRLSVVILY